MCTSLLIRGWPAGEEKHRLLQCSSSVFQPENAVCLWDTLQQLKCLFLPPVSIALSCCDWMLVLALLLIDSPFTASRAQLTSVLLFYSAHQSSPVFGCTTHWKNSCHLISPSCQAMPFAFPSVEHLQVGGPPASCLSVEWGGPCDA